jgi:hypothetical protein
MIRNYPNQLLYRWTIWSQSLTAAMSTGPGPSKRVGIPNLQGRRCTRPLSHDSDASAEPPAPNTPTHASKRRSKVQKKNPKPKPTPSSSLRIQTITSASKIQNTSGSATVDSPPRITPKAVCTKGSSQIHASTQTSVSSMLVVFRTQLAFGNVKYVPTVWCSGAQNTSGSILSRYFSPTGI